MVTSNENSDQAKFEAVADKSYFFKVMVMMGIITGRVAVEQIDQGSGEELVLSGDRAESVWDY